MSDNPGTQWRRSSRSNTQGNQCVEVIVGSTVVAVRDSKDPDGPRLVFTPREWEAFVGGVKDGEFDLTA
ncbi:DUF397 domain-containing protein [Rhizohabitans arisaemae]|uniref:DUF397 domain-containing protein n=1 Tax=Rhizohabitans arisaemae TaxID=2720610 RepID=UPI0024B22451|nr:DUF397 domain-containing protein [Rhizohabitans arisaemae]